jgi:endogenous inhibitor of DNA gyrase (YacG/DUF329 family)
MKKRINITIKESLLSSIPGGQNPGNRSAFIEAALSEKLHSENELRIAISPATREWIESVAKVKKMSVADWLLSEFLLEARGWFTNCPKCHKPTHDTREVHAMPDELGKLQYIIECPFCGHEWEHVEKLY